MTKKFKLASLEYHKLKSTKEKIKKILNGTKIIESKTIKRGIITPLTVFDIDHVYTYLLLIIIYIMMIRYFKISVLSM